MPDNFIADPGAGGSTFAADDIAGVLYPRSKVGWGDDGAYNEIKLTEGLPIAGVRRDSDVALTTDGEIHPFTFNAAGRLKVSAAPADLSVATGSITASAQVVAIGVQRLSNLSISMVATSLVGHNATFEMSNNSTNGTDGNWYVVQVVRSNVNTVETTTGVLAATPVYMWQVNVSDYQWFRVRATAHTSGTAAYILSPSAYATEPIPAIQVTGTQPISGSLTSAGTVTPIPSTSQGASTTHHAISAATTNATIVKASAGVINNITLSNNTASAKFFKLFNLAVAPTVGTSTPVATIMIPANNTISVGCGPFGIRLATGIAYSLTGLMPVADTTALALNDVSVFINYT